MPHAPSLGTPLLGQRLFSGRIFLLLLVPLFLHCNAVQVGYVNGLLMVGDLPVNINKRFYSIYTEVDEQPAKGTTPARALVCILVYQDQAIDSKSLTCNSTPEDFLRVQITLNNLAELQTTGVQYHVTYTDGTPTKQLTARLELSEQGKTFKETATEGGLTMYEVAFDAERHLTYIDFDFGFRFLRSGTLVGDVSGRINGEIL